jgi:hypothetical protein
MLRVIMLRVIMLKVIMLRVIMLIVIMLRVIMPSECHYVESHYAECHCHYSQCGYAECRYADCHYTECCSTIASTYMGTDAIPLTNTEINALRASKGDWSFFEEKTTDIISVHRHLSRLSTCCRKQYFHREQHL